MMTAYFIGVDVGSGSARAGLFDATGNKLAQAVREIQQFRPQRDWVEQSSTDIWHQVCAAVLQVVNDARVPPAQIKGIGFDATCSLVALDHNDAPVTVSPTGLDEQNIIMWMDHRAIAEAHEINQSDSEVLRYVGGEISPEMELPKLLWLKRHLPTSYQRSAKFFDLADFLAYRACGRDVRSVCTKACKWTYLAHENRWDTELLASLDLTDLISDNKVGDTIADIGTAAGTLSGAAAQAMGLTTQTIVAVGMIDAHAGGVGTLGDQPETTLAIIGGTSSCHMAVSASPLFIDGVWGPYWGAMLPAMWLNEGGQSAAGSLIDYVIHNSAFYPTLVSLGESQNLSVYEVLNNEVYRLESEEANAFANVHMLGYHHGNRSPRANPNLRGMVSGLSLNADLTELAKIYMASIGSVSYGTRHIIEAMNAAGHRIEKIHMCGGGTKNPLWLREHANITGLPITLGKEDESVILGSAMIAATASGNYSTLTDAMSAMYHSGSTITPQPGTANYHDAKYRIFHEMYQDQMKYQSIMDNR